MAKPRKLCDPCKRANSDPHFQTPTHLVHPVTRMPRLFDIYGNAVCPICGAKWHRFRNEAKLVE